MRDAAPTRDAADLTRYIETRYHARHRQQLPALAAMAEKIETVHSGNAHLPDGLSEVLYGMIGGMEVHMKKEELILFPAIRKGVRPGIAAPIAVMRADHDDHAREIAGIRRLTGDLTLPEGACGTWAALYAGLEEFITELEEHIRLENEVLFPQFETRGAAHG
jgi:regulator of cell morphogenesis and NO signaling